ncbi:MAG: glycosyltransferase family 4 protein [Fastidiosipilaceae bacterium]|jgi:glycosyltransferase involved in cell wall biosynthesis
MTEILFLHNTIMPYRVPFFLSVSKKFRVRYVFTDIRLAKTVYGRDPEHEVGFIARLDYTTIQGKFLTLRILRELFLTDANLYIDSFDRHGITTFAIAKLRNKKIILWSEEWDWKEKCLLRQLFDPVYKLIVKNTDAILVPGSKHRDYYISLGACSEKVFLMPNVSNISQKEEDIQNKQTLATQLKIKDQKVILYVGRLVERKGVDYLIRGFAKFKEDYNNTVLIIVGDGECSTRLKTLARDLGITDSVHFQGYVDDEYLAAYYLLSNVCVVPSITQGMGDPWVFIINEAMYFGKPVIASDAVGAAFDMVENGKNGYIVPERNSEAIYQALKDILGNPDVEREMGHHSKQMINERFRYANMVEGFAAAVEYVWRK